MTTTRPLEITLADVDKQPHKIKELGDWLDLAPALQTSRGDTAVEQL